MANNSKRKGAYSKRKGNKYELKIIKELIELGFEGLVSARSESKSLDNDKIDIADPQGQLPFYVQCKCTKNYPKYHEIIEECPRKDRPLIVFHNKQVSKEVNMVSSGEFIIMEESYFNIIKGDSKVEFITKETKNTPSYDKLLKENIKGLKHVKNKVVYIVLLKKLFYELIHDKYKKQD